MLQLCYFFVILVFWVSSYNFQYPVLINLLLKVKQSW